MVQPAFLQFIIGVVVVAAADASGVRHCKTIPGDSSWPLSTEWQRLNQSVGGRLIATVPLASVCHKDPFNNFDATACAALKPVWDFPQTHFPVPAEIGPGWFQNLSCEPFTPTSKPCELGNYVSYAINVSSVDDIKAGISFAKKNNIRLVIKNSGHDVLGKSTGKGGLMLWTFNMKSISIIQAYKTANYSGPAVKLGAGVMATDAYEVADRAGYTIVGGSCPTVGLSGGYTQGGGHSPLTSKYGLSADNVLEWEVVTASGSHLFATPSQNSDLYWALSGGGAGTFGVVISMTVRLHPDGEIGAGSLSFNDTMVGNARFWDAVGAFQAELPSLMVDGSTISYAMTLNTFTTYSITTPGSSPEQVAARFNSLLAKFDSWNLPYSFSTTSSPSYLSHFARDFGPLPYGPFTGSQFVSSRLIPASVVTNPKSNAALTQVFRNATVSGNYYILCQALDVPPAADAVAPNAVLPAWRDTVSHCLAVAPWNWTVPLSEMQRRQGVLMNDITPALGKLTPTSGTYLNEANWAQQDWQHNFYGVNYPKLRSIKAKYDPDNLFYATTAVGSEAWVVDGSGRLCRA